VNLVPEHGEGKYVLSVFIWSHCGIKLFFILKSLHIVNVLMKKSTLLPQDRLGPW